MRDPRRLRGRALVAVGLSMVVPWVSADQLLEVAVRNRPEAPIQLLEAKGRLTVYQAAPTSRAFRSRATTVKYANVKNPESQLLYWEGRARYRNVTNRRIRAVQLEWELFDGFQKRQGSVMVTDEEGLDPRRQRSREWKQVVHHEGLVAATVQLAAVRFADGTIWNLESSRQREAQTEEAAQAQRAQEERGAERERLRRLYETQGLETLLEALNQ